MLPTRSKATALCHAYDPRQKESRKANGLPQGTSCHFVSAIEGSIAAAASAWGNIVPVVSVGSVELSLVSGAPVDWLLSALGDLTGNIVPAPSAEFQLAQQVEEEKQA